MQVAARRESTFNFDRISKVLDMHQRIIILCVRQEVIFGGLEEDDWPWCELSQSLQSRSSVVLALVETKH